MFILKIAVLPLAAALGLILVKNDPAGLAVESFIGALAKLSIGACIGNFLLVTATGEFILKRRFVRNLKIDAAIRERDLAYEKKIYKILNAIYFGAFSIWGIVILGGGI